MVPSAFFGTYHIPSSSNWILNLHACLYRVTRFTREKNNPTRSPNKGVTSSRQLQQLDWHTRDSVRSFNRRCSFSFLTPRRGRVISAPVSLFFSTGARPSERSTYGRRNPLLFLSLQSFLLGFFHLCRLSGFSDDFKMDPRRYTFHLSCQQGGKQPSPVRDADSTIYVPRELF